MPYRITRLEAKKRNVMKVDPESQFARCLIELFRQLRPTRVIETGTYLGVGTTVVIAASLRHWQVENARFFSIEVNPRHHALAVENLARMGLPATLLLGLSVPRALLPSPDDIRRDLVETEVDGVFVDHMPEQRVQRYAAETDFPGCDDDLLGRCLREFDYRPQFMLLDSAGHMGHVEFNYVLPQLKSRCYFALDDTLHVKHYRSLQQIKQDGRFRVLAESDEKFGFCIAEFNP